MQIICQNTCFPPAGAPSLILQLGDIYVCLWGSPTASETRNNVAAWEGKYSE